MKRLLVFTLAVAGVLLISNVSEARGRRGGCGSCYSGGCGPGLFGGPGLRIFHGGICNSGACTTNGCVTTYSGEYIQPATQMPKATTYYYGTPQTIQPGTMIWDSRYGWVRVLGPSGEEPAPSIRQTKPGSTETLPAPKLPSNK